MPVHQPEKTSHRRFGRWHRTQTTPTRQAAAVATALTAPINATANADWAASDRTPQFCGVDPKARTMGMSTHGASIIGIVSEEIDVRVVTTRGESANAVAAIRREVRLPMPSASASRMIPQNPAISRSAHQMRWVIHGGIASTSPSAKNAPCGKK